MEMFHSIRKNDIFISYSDKDTQFVKKLDAAIRRRGRDPWVDWEDLASDDSSASWQCIETGIRDAELFVFIISPDSVTAEKNNKNIEELELAEKHNKHIVVICWRELAPTQELPPVLSESKERWILVERDDGAIDRVTDKILNHDTYARLLLRAEQWDKAQRSEELLLSGRDLANVKRWVESSKLPLEPLQQDYLKFSSEAEEKHPRSPGIFISYSRRDRTFVEELLKKLKEQQDSELLFWIDWKNIPVASDWQQEIYEGIEKSHTFLFILSPCSAISEVCCDEIAHAVMHGKRIIPVLLPQLRLPQDTDDLWPADRKLVADYRALSPEGYVNKIFQDFETVDCRVTKKVNEKLKDRPESLRNEADKGIPVKRRQAFRFSHPEIANQDVQELIEGITTDLSAAKYQTELNDRASKWLKNGRDHEYLLFSKELTDAKKFLADCEAREREDLAGNGFKPITLTNLQKSYIEASRKARRQKRKRIALISAIPIIGTLLLFTGLISTERGRIGEMVSSLENVEELDALVTALRAGSRLQGWAGAFNSKNSNLEVRVVTALQQEIYNSRERNRLTDPWLKRVSNVSYSPDGQFVVAASEGGISIWGQNDQLICQLPTEKPSLSIAFDPAVVVKTQTSYQIFATAGDEGTVQLWQIISSSDQAEQATQGECDTSMVRSLGTLLQTASPPKAEDHSINSLTFSPSGLKIAAARNDGTVSLWSRQAGNVDDWQSEPPLVLRHNDGDKDKVNSISFSPDGKKLATAGEDGTVKLWTLNQKLLKGTTNSLQPLTLKHSNRYILSISFSANSELLASGSEDGTVKLWKTTDGQPIPLGGQHEGVVSRVAFSAEYNNERFLASAGEDDSVRLWEIVTDQDDGSTAGKSLHVLRGHQGDVYRVAFHRDNQTLITASEDDTIKLWAWREGKLLESLEGHRGGVVGIDISSDSKELASASADRSIKLWDLENRIQTLPHNNRVNDVAFYPNPNPVSSTADNVVVAGGLQSVKLWQQDGKLISKEKSEQVNDPLSTEGEVLSLSFSPDGQWLVSGGELTKNGGEIGFWKWNQKTQTVTRLSQTFQPGVISEISFSPKGNLVATAYSDGLINLWQIKDNTLALIHNWQSELQINSISFSVDGKYFAVAGTATEDAEGDERSKSAIEVWRLKGDASDFTQVATEAVASWQTDQGNNVFSVSFSDDRIPRLASAGADGSIKLWSLQGEQLKTLKDQGRPPHQGEVYSVTFSPNGMLLASAGEDGTIKLWTKRGTLITTLKRHRRSVRSVSFSQDSKALASAGQDGNVYLWGLPDFSGNTNILDDLLTQGCTLASDFIQSKPLENREEVEKLDSICDRHLKPNWLTRLFGQPALKESEPERIVPGDK